jgi:hypothetical protein
MRSLLSGRSGRIMLLFPLLGAFTSVFSQAVSTTAYPVVYYSGNPTIPVDPGLTITSTVDITDVRVTITHNLEAGDTLNYTGSLPSGITASYNATYGELLFTGTATALTWQSFLRTVTFRTTSTITDDRTVTFSIGNLLAGSNGHFYEYVPFGNVANILTWKQSKDSAAAKNYFGWHGYLATITSQQENDIIFNRLSASGWIGSTDDYAEINLATGVATYNDQTTSEGNWYWVTGPEAGTQFSHSAWPGATPSAINGMYLNWSANEPNNNWNTTVNGVQGEQYGEIYAGISPWGQPGKWNDFYNLNADMDFVQGYVLEYGGMAADTSLTLAANRTVIFSGFVLTLGTPPQNTPGSRNAGLKPINWSYFPNPVNYGSNIQVKITASQKSTVRVAIFTISGQRMRDMPVTVQAGIQSFSLFTSDLPSGAYLLGIIDQNGSYIGQIQRIIISNK